MLSTGWYQGGEYGEYAFMAGTSMAAPLAAGAAAAAISYIYEMSGVYPTNHLVEKILKEGYRKQANLEAQVQNGAHLDMVKLFEYIDTEILGLEPACR